eukprot:GABV01009946.1.p1 GENE.GABV01009946.1~~GABV01009946.1.p1  ORF type:complete len:157 (+),score=49.56 GABV01009946.1:1-471(+)
MTSWLRVGTCCVVLFALAAASGATWAVSAAEQDDPFQDILTGHHICKKFEKDLGSGVVVAWKACLKRFKWYSWCATAGMPPPFEKCIGLLGHSGRCYSSIELAAERCFSDSLLPKILECVFHDGKDKPFDNIEGLDVDKDADLDEDQLDLAWLRHI